MRTVEIYFIGQRFKSVLLTNAQGIMTDRAGVSNQPGVLALSLSPFYLLKALTHPEVIIYRSRNWLLFRFNICVLSTSYLWRSAKNREAKMNILSYFSIFFHVLPFYKHLSFHILIVCWYFLAYISKFLLELTSNFKNVYFENL